jgi:peptide methionine sulfoxide reductase MsrA
VGYAGGTTPNPTYRDIGDHTEIIQIDYDPNVVSYQELLNLAKAQGDFDGMSFSRQYRSVVLYHNDQQRKTARMMGIKQLEPFRNFTRAEDYHQKYYLQQSPVAEDFFKRYPDAKSFTDSTAVTRANGIVGGYVNKSRLKRIVPELGVTQSHQKALYDMAGKAPTGCAISP